MLTIGDFNSFWGFLGHPVVNNSLEDSTDEHPEALTSKSKQLKLMHLNTQSMVSTFDELLVTIREYPFDVVAMSET